MHMRPNYLQYFLEKNTSRFFWLSLLLFISLVIALSFLFVSEIPHLSSTYDIAQATRYSQWAPHVTVNGRLYTCPPLFIRLRVCDMMPNVTPRHIAVLMSHAMSCHVVSYCVF